MNRVKGLLSALISPRWRWITLGVLLLMAVLARLGIWQLDRLAERRAANAQLAAALASSYILGNDDLSAVAGTSPADVSSDLANRDVFLEGVYDFAAQRILKLQNWQGQPGVHLVTPLVLKGSEAAVLVDRGWIPDAEYAAGHLFDAEQGAQSISGYIALSETLRRRASEAPAGPDSELFRVDVAAIGQQISYPLVPYYIKLAPTAEADTVLPIEVPKEIDLSEGPHLSYAVQWFIFSLGLGAGYVSYVNRWLARQAA